MNNISSLAEKPAIRVARADWNRLRMLANAVSLADLRIPPANRLEALNPLAVLRRGYAVVRASGSIVHSAGQVQPGQALEIRVARGSIDAEVTRTQTEE